LALFHVQKDRVVCFSQSFLDPLVIDVLVLLVFVKYLTPPFFILQHLFVLNLRYFFIFQVLIKPVFDLADSPSKQRLHLRDLAPLASNFLVHHKDERIFLWGPLPSYDGGVDHVVPPLPALTP
jgi:hypothetical protein